MAATGKKSETGSGEPSDYFGSPNFTEDTSDLFGSWELFADTNGKSPPKQPTASTAPSAPQTPMPLSLAAPIVRNASSVPKLPGRWTGNKGVRHVQKDFLSTSMSVHVGIFQGGPGVKPGRTLGSWNSDISTENLFFLTACHDPKWHFNPRQLGFIPKSQWLDHEMTFGEVVQDFFQKKNSSACRFSHKLFNALRLCDWNQSYFRIVGVAWIDNSFIKVDKQAFARLLGIRSIDGSLFHQQGNFPSHGFIEIGSGDVKGSSAESLDLNGVDFENVRLLYHQDKLFTRDGTEHDIQRCRWAQVRPNLPPDGDS
jgi:hypothetical protein